MYIYQKVIFIQLMDMLSRQLIFSCFCIIKSFKNYVKTN